MSNEKKWLFRGFVGEKTLPSYVGIVAKHCKDPVLKQPVSQWKVRPVFFVAHMTMPTLRPLNYSCSLKSRVEIE